MDATHFVRKTTSLEIRDLPADVLILVFSLLDGQDIARCNMVCRCFVELIRSDLRLQYQIALAQNGMVDGESSTLPICEKLQRLRQYSSSFQRGAFRHEDLTAHPDYVLQQADLGWPRAIIRPERPSGTLYKAIRHVDSPLYLSHFIPGSEKGGIPSSRSLFPIREAVKPDRMIKRWAMDVAQDLFIMVEMIRTHIRTNVSPDVYMRLYSLSSLKMDTATPHPATTFPLIHLDIDGPGEPSGVYELQIVGDHAVFEICFQKGAIRSYSIHVYNWKTAQPVSRVDVGKNLVSIVPLDGPYLLLFPTAIMPQAHPDIRIYSFSPSPSSGESVAAGRHICTLEVPHALLGERITWCGARTGDRAEETKGHFRTDVSRSIVVIYIRLGGPTRMHEGEEEDEDSDSEFEYEYDTYLLVPRATLAAQINAAESTRRDRDGGDAGEGLEDTPSQSVNEPKPLCVPWADWGPRGCLRLNLQNTPFHTPPSGTPTPFGSRLPVVVSDGPQHEGACVYVFDVNPLVARSARLRVDDARPAVDDADALAAGPSTGAGTVTAVVENIEGWLPGAVYLECAAIPYVVYRFPLAYSSGAGSPDAQAMMSMAGFTVEFSGGVESEKRFQTWTV